MLLAIILLVNKLPDSLISNTIIPFRDFFISSRKNPGSSNLKNKFVSYPFIKSVIVLNRCNAKKNFFSEWSERGFSFILVKSLAKAEGCRCGIQWKLAYNWMQTAVTKRR